MVQISIIVPIYKVEKYLERCINSIINQTFEDFELILVDDGSPDKCPELCDQWAKRDRRIKVIHKTNGGLSSARNEGLKICEGNYVFFVDSDDWIERDALKALYSIAVYEKADIVVGNMHRDKKYVLNDMRYNFDNDSYRKYDRDSYLNMYLKITTQKTRYYACAKLYSKSVASHIQYPDGYTAEDVAGTFYALANAKEIIETEFIVYHYFVNSEGITGRKLNPQYKDMYHSWKQVIAYAESNLPEYVEKCDYNLMRIDLPVLVSFVIKPVDNSYTRYLIDLKETKYRLNNNYSKLMRGPLPKSKKIVLTICRIIPVNLFIFIAKIRNQVCK